MKYPQLVSSNAAVAAISDWLVFKLDELGVDAPLVFSRFLLSLLHYQAKSVDLFDIQREAVESLKQVASSKESEIALLVEELYSKIKKTEEEPTIADPILFHFQPLSQNDQFQQMEKEQVNVEEDPKKKYYMAFPALGNDINSEDYVSKTLPKSLNWPSIINIRSDKLNTIQNQKKFKSKRKKNIGRGKKFDNHKKNMSDPEPALWDMDFKSKGPWEMGSDLYCDFISRQNLINTEKIDSFSGNYSLEKNNLEYDEIRAVEFSSNNDLDASRDCEFLYFDNEQQLTDRKPIDLFEISENICDSQNFKELKSKFDSKVKALWNDQNENDCRCHDKDSSENIIQNLLNLLQSNSVNNNNNSYDNNNTNYFNNNNDIDNYSEKALEQTATTHDFIKYGTNLNYSIWSDSVSVVSDSESFWERSNLDSDIEKNTIKDETTKSTLEWSDCVFEMLHSMNIVRSIEADACYNEEKPKKQFLDAEAECYMIESEHTKIPLVEVTLPNHSAHSRFSEVVPSFFKAVTQQQSDHLHIKKEENASCCNPILLPSNVPESENSENLLTSEQTHFRPIKFPISYVDGYSFRISNSPSKFDEVRSETGSLFIDTKKYMEYKKSNTDSNTDDFQKFKNDDDFFIKFQVKQNEKFCQTDADYNVGVYIEESLPKSARLVQETSEKDIDFWRMDNLESLSGPCVNLPADKFMKEEVELDGDEIMSDLSFIQSLYIGNDWNDTACYECIDGQNENEYYDNNYYHNIVYDLLKPETTKTLSEVLTQQAFVPISSSLWRASTDATEEYKTNIIENDHKLVENQNNNYNSITITKTVSNHHHHHHHYASKSNKDYFGIIQEVGNVRKRRYSECRKKENRYLDGAKVLPIVQDSIALENYITYKFWATNFTFIDNNENNNYSNILIGLSRPLTR